MECRTYGEICIGYHNKDKNLEKRNNNNRSSGCYGKFCCKVTWSEYSEKNVYAPLPLNEEEKHFGGKLNDINYKITVRKLHYTGLEKQLFHFC